MKPSKVSVIVPVYNAEKYLERCIDSLLSQTMTDWELILVDDGSADSSGRMCDEIALANPDRKISVLHKPNGGVATAREAGMEAACGEYSIHLDPDDFIEPDMLEKLYGCACATGADMVVCDFLLDYGPANKKISVQEPGADSDRFMNMLLDQKRHGSLCNKLIRTELYRKYDLHFPPEMICWEDLFICCSILMQGCRVAYVPEAFYHYDLHSNSGSMTRMATHRTIAAMQSFVRYFEHRLPQKRIDRLFEVKAMILDTAFRCRLLSAAEIRQLYPEINQRYVAIYAKCCQKPLQNAVARVLSGASLQSAHRLMRINTFMQKVKRKLKR